MSKNSTFSVFGTDITIKGDVEASADLHVDGRIIGDIACSSLVQGESSHIEGSITAESARLSGHVKGTIVARDLVILSSARIEGDVSYQTLTIEQGATVDGRFGLKDRREASPGIRTGDLGNKGEDGEHKLSLAG